MSKYDVQFKVKLVKQYLSGDCSYRELAGTYAVDISLLRYWVDSYRLHGESGLKHKHSLYSAEFKHKVLQHIARDGLSDRQATALYDIRSIGTIGKWRRAYNEGGSGALMPRRKGKSSMPKKLPPESPSPNETRTQKELLEELAYLRAENAYLKKLKALSDAERTVALVKKRK